MKTVVDGKGASASRRVLLHLLGGSNSRGGMMNYVRQLVRQDLPSFEQRIWKYRGYAAENESYLLLGKARTTDVNLKSDVTAALLDFMPLYCWLRRNPTAVLYAHSRAGSILSTLIRQVRRVPVITHVHVNWRRTGFHRFLWRAARSTVIFNSSRTSRHFGVPPKTGQIHMPTIQWRQRPEPGEGRLVACSAIQPIKNIHLIIEAFIAAGDGAPRTLHIYGLSPTPFDPNYQQRIVELVQREPRICLHDWDEHWSDRLGYNDIFIHASCLESFGIVMLEAFARGCRMVVPQDTFLNDLSQEGIFCADLTAESLAQAIRLANSYKSDSKLWEARLIFQKQFAIETVRDRLSSLLCSQIGVESL